MDENNNEKQTDEGTKHEELECGPNGCKVKSSDKHQNKHCDGKGAEHKIHELKKELEHCQSELKTTKSALEKAQAELEECKVKASQYLNTASYYKNESENHKKDYERLKERNKNIENDAKIMANEVVAKKLLPIIDDFDQAMLSVTPEVMKGFVMIYSSLTSTLKELGVVEIVCKNEVLDPEKHNCIEAVSTDDEAQDGHIAKVYQKGYMFEEGNKVIRPATVSVYKLG